MARRRGKGRVYWRERGGVARAYGDFRDFADVGGGREALRADHEKLATDDPEVAEQLAADRVKQLQERRRGRALHGVEQRMTLKQLVSLHLVQKAKSGKVERSWIEQTEAKLKTALGFFGMQRDPVSITVRDVQRYANFLAEQPNGRGGTFSGGTCRHYLNVVSNLFRRAQAEGCVPPGYNPVAALLEKPTAARREARWLEIHEGALLLESARTYAAPLDAGGIPFMYPLLATFLLTGGRKSEVLGLAVEDVSFDRKTVTFRPHEWRRLKTLTSFRTVPLWPQLEEILRPYVFARAAPLGTLLFPSTKTADEAALTALTKSLDAVAKRAGWKAGEIRTKMFRHTYTAARLQTLDRGAPVSLFTVSRELGHGGDSLVKRVYGHLGTIRHRSEAVEYRVEHHEEQLRERLKALQ